MDGDSTSSITLETSEEVVDRSKARALQVATVESMGGVELRRTPSVNGTVGVRGRARYPDRD
jgi:hypothetical protein